MPVFCRPLSAASSSNEMNCFTRLTWVTAATIFCTVNGATLRIAEEAADAGSRSAAISGFANWPRIIGRDEWGARKCASPGYSPMTISPTPYVVAHHGGIPHYCYDQETCSRIVRGYQDFHMDTHGWIDVGYHFIIGGDGNVYEGRGWDNVGAHAPGYNTQGIGICIIGDYSSHLPNNASLNAFERLIDYGVSIGKIRPGYKLIGHRQGRATECPGRTFFQYLQSLPAWESSPVPLFATSALPVARTKSAVTSAVPTVDITGTKLWSDLIALGVPVLGESKTTAKTATSTTGPITVDGNVVDTMGNSEAEVPSN